MEGTWSELSATCCRPEWAWWRRPELPGIRQELGACALGVGCVVEGWAQFRLQVLFRLFVRCCVLISWDCDWEQEAKAEPSSALTCLL